MTEPEINEITARNIRKRFSNLFLNFIHIFLIVLCILGFFGFMNGFFVTIEKAFWVGNSVELPLGDLGSIAADGKGNIYLASYFYQRIQKYSPDGKFLKGWPSGDNNPRIRINENEMLESANNNRTRNEDFPDTLTIYDLDGNLISKKIEENCHRFFGEACEKYCYDKNGNLYSIQNKFFNPHVIKTNPQGDEIEAVQTPWYLWLVMGPLPAWLFFALGLLGFSILLKLRKRLNF